MCAISGTQMSKETMWDAPLALEGESTKTAASFECMEPGQEHAVAVVRSRG